MLGTTTNPATALDVRYGEPAGDANRVDRRRRQACRNLAGNPFVTVTTGTNAVAFGFGKDPYSQTRWTFTSEG